LCIVLPESAAGTQQIARRHSTTDSISDFERQLSVEPNFGLEHKVIMRYPAARGHNQSIGRSVQVSRKRLSLFDFQQNV
jgi:hypothetical protein